MQVQTTPTKTAVAEPTPPAVIKVTSPEHWPEAVTVKDQVQMDTLQGPMIFEIRAQSYGEDIQLVEDVPDPKPPTRESRGITIEDRENEDYVAAANAAFFKRVVGTIDQCWKKIPGDDLAAKAHWVSEHAWRPGEINHLYNAILALSGLHAGEAIVPEALAKPIVADPDTWALSSQVRVAYMISRAGQRLTFELTGLSQLKQNQIVMACKPPEPPLKPIHDKITGKRTGVEPDLNDAKYKAAVQAADQYERVMKLELALPFKLPGDTNEQKLEWLKKRPVYEVRGLLMHLNHNILSYRNRSDFI